MDTYPIFLEFSNITFSPHIKKNRSKTKEITQNKKILSNISGYALPGEILAILGPSGSGKTTLLNIISDRMLQHYDRDNLVRNVKVNNVELDHNIFGKFSSFVTQQDLLFESLTPKETLIFGALLKLRASTKNDVIKRTSELILEFGLEKCQNTYISSLSGGEKKRTSIAYELITDPKLILIDEPTTGVDSFTSEIIMKNLYNLAKKANKTVICSLHQPSNDLVKYLEKILLIKEGRMVCHGSLQFVLNEFFPFPIKKFYNPFDYFLDMIDNNDIEFLSNLYSKKVKDKEEIEVDKYRKQYEIYSSKILEIHNQKNLSNIQEFWILLRRNSLNYYRNKGLFVSRFIQYFVNSIILILYFQNIYFQSDKKYDLIGFCFNLVNNFFCVGMYSTIYTIYVYKSTFIKEYSCKLFTIPSFFASMVASLYIPSIIYSFIFTLTIEYFIIHSGIFKMLIIFLLNCFDFIIGASLGAYLGLTYDENKIFSVAPFIFALIMVGSGVFRNNNSFPSLFKWINTTSPYKYFMEVYISSISEIDLNISYSFDFGYFNSILVLILIFLFLNFLCFRGLKKIAKNYRL